MENHPRYRSLFWPILLVGIGVVWLLSNLGYIQPVSIGSVLRLWPVLLIVFGLDMLFGRRFPWVGGLVGLAAVGGVVLLLLAGPQLGFTTGTTTQSETFNVPLADTNSVEYFFDTASAPVDFSVMREGSSDLIRADIIHRGTINFDVSGNADKRIKLSEDFSNSGWLDWGIGFERLKWDIALAPDVPSVVNLNGGSGSINMDLAGLQLTSLSADLGSGSSRFALPQSYEKYSVMIESGSGSVNLDLPKNTSLTITLDTGSGSTNISLPAGIGLRIIVEDDGSGSLNLPSGLEKSPDFSAFSIGAWQTKDFDQAKNQVTVTIEGQGSGSISIN